MVTFAPPPPPVNVLTAIPSKVFKLGQVVSAYISSISNKKVINSPNSQNINKVSTTTDIVGWKVLEDLPFIPNYNATTYTANAFYIFGTPTNGQEDCPVYVNSFDMYGELTGWVKDPNYMAGGTNTADVVGNTSICINGKLYSFGGTSSSYGSIVDNFMCTINADNSLGTWSVITPFPAPIDESPGVYFYGVKTVFYGNRIYASLCVGVNNYVDVYDPENNVATSYNDPIYALYIYSAPLNGDGTIGAWRTEINSDSELFYGYTYTPLHIWNNYLICTNVKSDNSIIIFNINSDGTLSPILDAISGNAQAGSLSPAIVIGNELYTFTIAGQVYKQTISMDPANPTTNVLLSSEIYLPTDANKNQCGPFVKGDINNEGYIYTLAVDNTNTYSYFNKYPIINGNGISRCITVKNALDYSPIYPSILVTSSKVYNLGGDFSYPKAYSANINLDGTFDQFVKTNDLAYPIVAATLIKSNNKVFLIGGANGVDGYGNYTVNTIQSATINPDGTLGPWSIEVNKLPHITGGASSVLIGNKIYVIGGYDGNPDAYGGYDSYVNVIQSTTINPDGTLGPWSIETNKLPQGVSSGDVVVTNSHVYLISGLVDGNSGLGAQVIYYTTINSDNTLNSWLLASIIAPNLRDFKLAATANKVFLIGGTDIAAINPASTVYVSTINVDGTLSAFVDSGNDLQVPQGGFGVAVTSNYIHLLGGSSFNDTKYFGMMQTAKFDGWVNSNTSDILPDGSFTPITVASQVVNGDLITVTGNPVVGSGKYLAVKIDANYGDTIKEFKGEVWYGGGL
jgi:hypothetical protein